jgi:hypothetical protein
MVMTKRAPDAPKIIKPKARAGWRLTAAGLAYLAARKETA